MMPKDTCDAQGNCYPDPNGDGDVKDYANQAADNGTANSGKVQNPIGKNPLMFFTDPKLTVGQTGIQQLWVGGVAIVDVFMVILIAVNGIRIMVSGSVFRYADVAESLPRILVALIAAHISLALVGILLGLNNSLCAAFLEWGNKLTINTKNMPDGGNITFQDIFKDMYNGMGGWTGMVKDTFLGSIPGLNSLTGSQPIALTLLEQLPRMILQLVALVMSAMLFAQLIVRIMLIDLFTVISAPCIACWALPGRAGQPATNFWLQGTIGAIMTQFLQTVGIIVSQLIFDTIFTQLNNNVPGFLKGNDVVKLVVYLAMLWFILRMPSLFRLNPSTQMIMAGGQAVGQAAQGVASAAATAATTVVTVGVSAGAMLAK
jgi:hypothetical protein